MKSLLLAGAVTIATGTRALAQGAHRVVRNSDTATCEIVTDAQVGGNVRFGSGPFDPIDQAKLAHSSINACPAVEEPPATTPEDKSDKD